MKKEKQNWLQNLIGFILAPFAKLIRYILLKIMKKLRRPYDKRPSIATSDYILNEIILPLVFSFFNEEEFREFANFKNIPRAEHDRIFNELEVAGICLAIMYLRMVKSLNLSNDYHFWQDTEEYLPKKLQETLMEYGVGGSDAKLIRELIDIRRKEYEKLAETVWHVSNEEDTEFKNLPPELKQFAAAMQGIAIGTADHIKRGKVKEGDPLIRHITDWLIILQRKIKNFASRL